MLKLPIITSDEWLDHATRVEEVLERVFRLANSTWARDFLFDPNGAVDAGILISPLHLQYKLAGKTHLDLERYMNSDLSLCAEYRLRTEWIMVPAFHSGQHGACYFVHREKRLKPGTNQSS